MIAHAEYKTEIVGRKKFFIYIMAKEVLFMIVTNLKKGTNAHLMKE